MRLTERDFDLLTFLAAQGVATTDQLVSGFFPSRSTCQARLHFLMQADLIESVPLAALKGISRANFQQSADALLISKHDLWKYRVYRLTERLRSLRAGSDSFSEPALWKHQLRLNGVRKLLEQWFPSALVLTDPDIQAEERRFKMGRGLPVADLVVRAGGNEIAVEVERTRKSETEYHLRLIDYRDSHYSHILYFCESERIFNKVAALSSGISKIGVSRLLAPEMVFRHGFGFVTTKTFLGFEN